MYIINDAHFKSLVLSIPPRTTPWNLSKSLEIGYARLARRPGGDAGESDSANDIRVISPCLQGL